MFKPFFRIPATLVIAGSALAMLAPESATAQRFVRQRVESPASDTNDAAKQDKAATEAGKAGKAEAWSPAAASRGAPATVPGAGAAPSQDQSAASAPPAPQSPAAKVESGVAATAAAIAASRAKAAKRDRGEEEGIDDERDAIRPVLAKHPDSNLVICVAGCGPEPQIVQVLPKEPQKKTDAQVIPNSAANDDANSASDGQPSTGEIRCIAGCAGQRGEVVFKRARISWIDPNESERVRHALREIAGRLAGELKVVTTAEQSTTLTTWAGMSRQMIDATVQGATVADASGDAPPR